MSGGAQMDQPYHYVECGLDYIYLVNGFDVLKGPDGRDEVTFHDEDGLSNAIASMLVAKRHRLTGKEFRFLRTKMLLSQATLAHIIGVKELTVARWEKGETEIPQATDAVLRKMYSETVESKNKTIRELLETISEMEDALDEAIRLKKPPHQDWKIIKSAA